MICNRVNVGRVICTALYFLFCGIEYAVILPTLNRYLMSLNAPNGFLGIVMASFSFTGLITAPIYGKISDKTGSTKLTVVVSNLFEIVGNLLYFFGETFYVIWIARLVAGIGSGSSSSILGMLSKATSQEERTLVFSALMSMRQVGLIFGPGLNIFLEKMDSKLWNFPINQYTSPGLLMAGFWAFQTILMIIAFRDVETSRTTENEEMNTQTVIGGVGNAESKADGRSFLGEFLREEVILLLALTFVTMFAQTGIEAAITPMTLLFFDWDGKYNSYMYCAAGAVVVIGYIILALLSKRFSDRFLLLLGCICMVLTYLLDTAYTSTLTQWNRVRTLSWLLPVFFVGTFFLTLGLPFIWVTLASLFSKITSIETQGFNQGIRLVVLGIGQIIGPIWAAPMATQKWLPIMLGIDLLIMSVLTIMLLTSYDKLLPPQISANSSSLPVSDEHRPLLKSDGKNFAA